MIYNRSPAIRNACECEMCARPTPTGVKPIVYTDPTVLEAHRLICKYGFPIGAIGARVERETKAWLDANDPPKPNESPNDQYSRRYTIVDYALTRACEMYQRGLKEPICITPSKLL